MVALSVPLRHQDFQELCTLCREPARARCVRCTAPLCARHEPRRGRRCATCEHEYHDGLLRSEIERAERWLLVLDRNRDFGAGNTYRRNTAMRAVAALALLWGKTAAKWLWIRWGWPRRRFLGERKHQALPPARAPGELPGEAP